MAVRLVSPVCFLLLFDQEIYQRAGKDTDTAGYRCIGDVIGGKGTDTDKVGNIAQSHSVDQVSHRTAEHCTQGSLAYDVIQEGKTAAQIEGVDQNDTGTDKADYR